jgi:hypothetical protein
MVGTGGRVVAGDGGGMDRFAEILGELKVISWKPDH